MTLKLINHNCNIIHKSGSPSENENENENEMKMKPLKPSCQNI